MPNKEYLFKEFPPVSEKEWKQRIQMELKGADYTKTLVWESLEGIHVKPFYHADSYEYIDIPNFDDDYKIGQEIFIDKPEIANKIALDALKKGADTIFFTAKQSFDVDVLFQNFDTLDKEITIFFDNQFLSESFSKILLTYFDTIQVKLCYDPIGDFITSGNWFKDKKNDFTVINSLFELFPDKTILSIKALHCQNSGANIVQQIAYALAHANEYIKAFGKNIIPNLQFEFAIGSNYFFEIAKLRAFRYLWQQIQKEYNVNHQANIIAKPSLRNKTLYDYNVNLLRSTTEYMSAILGGANIVISSPYDSIFKKSNHFSERIARNQLLILKEENHFKGAQNFAKGSYYIESLTLEIAKKSLTIFQEIDKSGGFLYQLESNKIQQKIQHAAEKEQNLFDNGEIVLLGTNKYPNTEDLMKEAIELYPFSKKEHKQTSIQPISYKRLSEKLEKERLETEQFNS